MGLRSQDGQGASDQQGFFSCLNPIFRAHKRDAIAAKRDFIARLEAGCRNLEEKIMAFELDVKEKEKRWRDDGVAIDAYKKGIDLCTAKLVLKLESHGFSCKNDPQYFMDLQCIYNHLAKWMKLRDDRLLIQGKNARAGGWPGYLVDLHKQLFERKSDLRMNKDRLDTAKEELARLEVEFQNEELAIAVARLPAW